MQRGPWFLAHGTLKQKVNSQLGPRQPTTTAGVSVRCVLAGGKVLGGEEQAPHDLQDLLITMVGDVHKKQWGSMAGGEE
jgi:hypothetical protein